MEMFEYDTWKLMSNLEKHGIDFQEAQELWLDPGLVEFRLYHSGERRWAAIARLRDGLWTAIFTTRGGRIRLISVRRSTMKEVSFYDKANDC